MSATGLEVFDKTLQTTHIWLKSTSNMRPRSWLNTRSAGCRS